MKRNLRPIEDVQAKVSKNDFFEAVTGVATAKTATGKKDNGMLMLSPPEAIRKAVDEIVSWKKKEKEAKAEKESREVDIIDWVKEKQDKDGFSNNFQKSYRVQGINETITFVSSDRFSNITAENVPTLQTVLGKKFDEFVEKKMTVSLKEEVLRDEALQQELMNLIGKDKFQTFFRSEISYKPVDGFDKKLFSLGKTVVEKVREFIQQAKPSLR
jgi:hypothetical protein